METKFKKVFPDLIAQNFFATIQKYFVPRAQKHEADAKNKKNYEVEKILITPLKSADIINKFDADEIFFDDERSDVRLPVSLRSLLLTIKWGWGANIAHVTTALWAERQKQFLCYRRNNDISTGYSKHQVEIGKRKR